MKELTALLVTNAANATCSDLHGWVAPTYAVAQLMWYPGATNIGMAAPVDAAERALCLDALPK